MSQFPRPTMECGECGKPPHDGPCFPMLRDPVLLALWAFLAVVIIAGIVYRFSV